MRREVPFDPQWGVGKRGTNINDQLIPHSMSTQVVDALESLEDDARNLLERYFYERMTYAQIAEEFLGFENGQERGKQDAHYLVGQALKQLQAALEERGITDASFE